MISTLLIGCDNSVDQAPVNMKKADQYFAERQYEIADYYYEKIPEESPLYKEAQLKIEQIASMEQSALPKGPGADEALKITIFDQSITSNPGGVAPIHTIQLNNESVHKLASVQLEFSYFDAAGNLMGVKRCNVGTPILGKSQETFTGIAPGVLDAQFVTYRVKVISAEFQ